MIGQLIGNYRIVSELGKGGMGMVYLAEHVQLGRQAALKMLLPQFSSDAAIVQRFFNEARAASAIDHPGIVEIYDFGTHTDGSAYIVMALLKGESLDQRLKRAAMSPHDSATILAQVAGALAAAHARGIIHRDLKPDNIFLVPNELMPGGIQVKLLDFGIAKLADEQSAGVKTQTGALIGTPAYMSPEQCMGKSDLDHRTDLYALGCILFHMLCGRPPFLSDHGTGVLIVAHIRDTPPPPQTLNPRVPPALAAITTRLLEKEPAARFQTATELRNALIAAGANAPITKSGPDQYAATMAPTPYTGAVAFGATTASTTNSGSAAQLVAAAPAGATKKRGVWIGVGALLLALAGVGIFIAVREDHTPAPAAPAATPTPPPRVEVAVAATHDAAVEPDCPPGQTRRDDTHGHCCWPEQAWSSGKDRCVGVPVCPTGMIARTEQCIADVASLHGHTALVPASPPHLSSANVAIGRAAGSLLPTFQINAKSYKPGDTIKIRVSANTSTPPNRSWITTAAVGTPESSYLNWNYLDPAATSAELVAPTKPGPYEVRLHTDYPKKSFNVVHVETFTVASADQTPNADQTRTDQTPNADQTRSAVAPTPAQVDAQTPLAQQRFSLDQVSVHGGDTFAVRFPTKLHAATGEQFWITVVAHDAADTAWGAYKYVPPDASNMTLEAPKQAGEYEVRLHANYPKKSTNVVHRALLHVDNP